MRKNKQHLTTTGSEEKSLQETDDHVKVERLRAMSSLSTSAIAQRDQYAKWNEDAMKKIRILETECRVMERERDAARAIASDLLEQLKGLK
jgi:hypothetical protein